MAEHREGSEGGIAGDAGAEGLQIQIVDCVDELIFQRNIGCDPLLPFFAKGIMFASCMSDLGVGVVGTDVGGMQAGVYGGNERHTCGA